MLKMTKKLTLLVFDDVGTPVKQATIPRFLLPISALLVTCALIALYAGISDYLRLKSETRQIVSLRSTLKAQKELVAQQHHQLIAFNGKIDTLKTQLTGLHDFEKKIRVIANLDPDNDETSLFGVGGPEPDDANPATMMEQDYQEMVRDMHTKIHAIDQASQHQNESFSTLYKQLKGKRNLLSATPSIRPVKGWITSGFGYRVSPFTGRRELHCGLDIAAPKGSPIVATADGVITFAGKHGLLGNLITINHGYGMVTRYGHIEKLIKHKGDHVKRGEEIAMVGSTGRSTGPHVHYEVRVDGVFVNPMNYLLK
jgi:murein DD-endopeptidase MepM/ murein hydrolase activator NlpD